MTWIKNGALVLFAILLPIVAVEAYLAFAGRYSDLVADNQVASNTGWTRPANSNQVMRHPDLGYDIEVEFDDFGIRNHDAGSKVTNFTVGFFGDSFTENRRIEDRFTFSSLLNAVAQDSVFANFGIDNFGLEQSYQRWLNFSDRFNLEHVVYMFFQNDLRNMYEIQLFDDQVVEEGKLINRYENRAPTFRDRAIRTLGKFRITYLAIEAYFQLRARMENKDIAAIQRPIDRFGDAREEYRSRFHDEYSDLMIDEVISGDASAQTLNYVKKFKAVLRSWQEAVESKGAMSHIAVIPTYITREIAVFLFSWEDFHIIFLPETSETFEYNKYSTVFVNDEHWNEVGNLAATGAFLDYFSELGIIKKPQNYKQLLADQLLEIENLYGQYDSQPALAH